LPQFDHITFFIQVFWLFVFFTISYVIFLKVFLPKLAQVLKARTKKLSKGSSGLDNFNLEQVKTISFFNESLEKLMIMVKDDLSNFKTNSDVWLATNTITVPKVGLFESVSSLESVVYNQISSDNMVSSAVTSKKKDFKAPAPEPAVPEKKVKPKPKVKPKAEPKPKTPKKESKPKTPKKESKSKKKAS
jgi:hypothetical protein